MNTYQVITEKIIEQLEKGAVPWRKPWKTILPQNLISRKEYRGINSILLNCLPFEHPYFLTFKQVKALGGFVRHGEKGLTIVFWQFLEDEETEGKFPVHWRRRGRGARQTNARYLRGGALRKRTTPHLTPEFRVWRS